MKRISFGLNPWAPGAGTVRNVMFAISHENVRATNPKCAVRTEVLSTGPQRIRVELNDEHAAKPVSFRAETLTPLEVLYELNRIALPLVKVPDQGSGPTASKGASLMGKR